MPEQSQPKHLEVQTAIRLQQLSLSAEFLRGAVHFGYQEAASLWSKNDPSILPAWIRYGKSTGKLRDNLRATGWVAHRDHGYEITLNKEARLGIVVGHVPRSVELR